MTEEIRIDNAIIVFLLCIVWIYWAKIIAINGNNKSQLLSVSQKNNPENAAINNVGMMLLKKTTVLLNLIKKKRYLLIVLKTVDDVKRFRCSFTDFV